MDQLPGKVRLIGQEQNALQPIPVLPQLLLEIHREQLLEQVRPLILQKPHELFGPANALHPIVFDAFEQVRHVCRPLPERLRRVSQHFASVWQP